MRSADPSEPLPLGVLRSTEAKRNVAGGRRPAFRFQRAPVSAVGADEAAEAVQAEARLLSRRLLPEFGRFAAGTSNTVFCGAYPLA